MIVTGVPPDTGPLGGDTEITVGATIPAAVIGTSMGLPGALVTMLSVAASAAAASGVKMTAVMQLLPASSFPGHTCSRENCDASPRLTVNVMGPICTGVVPVFVRVTIFFP